MSEAVHKVEDQSGDHKYFVITPQLVWALARDPYDLALWWVVKMVAGDSEECYLSTPQLAALAMMSTGKVADCRRHLLQTGLLTGEIRRDPGYPQPVWHLRIPDLWQRNLKWRQELGDPLLTRVELKQSQSEQLKQKRKAKPRSVHLVNAPGEHSPSEQGISPGEQGISPGEQGISSRERKENQKENQKQEPTNNTSAANSVKHSQDEDSLVVVGDPLPLSKTQQDAKTALADVGVIGTANLVREYDPGRILRIIEYSKANYASGEVRSLAGFVVHLIKLNEEPPAAVPQRQRRKSGVWTAEEIEAANREEA
jgi:hypothetical protein